VEQFADKSAVEPERLDELLQREASLQEIGKVLGAEAAEVPDDFVRLVRIVEAAARTPSGEAALAEARALLAEMERAVQRVERAADEIESGSAGQLATDLESLSYRIENQEGLLTRYENLLARLGQGTG